jgi:nitrate/nitrite transporter NarK
MNFVDGTVGVFLALLLFSGSEAGSALNWALVGDLFGRKKFATIRGILAPMYNAALFVTPVAAGWIFDKTGSYEIVLLTGGGLFFAAAIVFFFLQAPVRDVLDVAARAKAKASAEKQ